MKLTNTQVFNFEGAFRGLRNPMNSWDRSDSKFVIMDINGNDCEEDYIVTDFWTQDELKRTAGEENKDWEIGDSKYENLWYKYNQWLLDVGCLRHDNVDKEYSECFEFAFLGPNDLGLAQKLILAGNEHAKFMRQIFISVDITAPIYFWKELDTYKVGTTANSTSTMHKLTSAPITKEMFELDKGDDLVIASDPAPHSCGWTFTFDKYIEDTINVCENLRQKYLETNDKRYWRALIQYLPQSYLQTRTWTANYSILRNLYFQRRNHRLKEWRYFCEWIESLPYGIELICIEGV